MHGICFQTVVIPRIALIISFRGESLLFRPIPFPGGNVPSGDGRVRRAQSGRLWSQATRCVHAHPGEGRSSARSPVAYQEAGWASLCGEGHETMVLNFSVGLRFHVPQFPCHCKREELGSVRPRFPWSDPTRLSCGSHTGAGHRLHVAPRHGSTQSWGPGG